MKKPFVFISYSTKDQQAADLVYGHLQVKGIPCWMASHNIEGGQSFTELIYSAIEECTAFVMISSTNSNDSDHVSNELTIAFDQRKKIIPFRIEEFEFSKGNKYHLVRAQWIDAYKNMNEGLRRLLIAVREVIPESPS